MLMTIRTVSYLELLTVLLEYINLLSDMYFDKQELHFIVVHKCSAYYVSQCFQVPIMLS